VPTYDYKCGECGFTEEALVPVDKRDNPLSCASCGGKMVRILQESMTFILKGQGWANHGYSKSVGDILKRGDNINIDEDGNNK